MDIASLIGFLGAVGMIIGAMISGGGVGPFIDIPSLLIVFGGTFFSLCTQPRYQLSLVVSVLWQKLFATSKKRNVITRMIELASIARKDGMMALEGQEVPDKFLEKAFKS